MVNRADIQTDARLKRLERELAALYAELDDAIIDEHGDEIEALHLDDPDATRRERQSYADDNGLDMVVVGVAGLILAANTRAADTINRGMRDVGRANWDYYRGYFDKRAGTDIGRWASNSSGSKYTQRAYNTATQKRHVEKAVHDAVTKSVKRGDSIPKMAAEIRKVSNRSRANSILVARTETTRIQNISRMDSFHAAERAGVKIRGKEWLATHDDRTRDSHAAIDGEIVGLDEDFSNGLEYPGDPDGEPEEVCNCRCTVRAVLEV